MEEELCRHYVIKGTTDTNDREVKLITDQLDELGVGYTFAFKDYQEFGGSWKYSENGIGYYDSSPACVMILFDIAQYRSWLERNVQFYSPPANDGFDHVITMPSENLTRCDRWLFRNIGPYGEAWIAGSDKSDFNEYRFKEATDAMAFRLMYGY